MCLPWSFFWYNMLLFKLKIIDTFCMKESNVNFHLFSTVILDYHDREHLQLMAIQINSCLIQ